MPFSSNQGEFVANKYNVGLQEWDTVNWPQAWANEPGSRAMSILAGIDVDGRRGPQTPTPFSGMVSQACQARHFRDPAYLKWAQVMKFGPYWHRKFWEWASIMETAEVGGVLRPGSRAVGFGVGQEPISAALALHDVDVLATDVPTSDSQAAAWATGLQHAESIDILQHPDICPPEKFKGVVSFRPVDMNALDPEVLPAGSFDFAWSSCVIEHLGSPKLAMDFVLNCAELLAPGGVMIHTTEYELLNRGETRDYGNCAIFRIDDLQQVVDTLNKRGFEANTDFEVSLASPEERWISSSLEARYPAGYLEPAHLRLIISESVSTSFSIIVRRPAQ
ncbi:MAG TPA: hypothetical protein DCQ04_11000 [Actinobacteria bacterium]|nr:hypothetical protein [Actinomycetota bacterium]